MLFQAAFILFVGIRGISGEVLLEGAGTHYLHLSANGQLTGTGILPRWYIQIGLPQPVFTAVYATALSLDLPESVTIEDISVGEFMSCFLLSNSSVTCAVDNLNIGVDYDLGRAYPYLLEELPGPASKISCSDASFACSVLLSDGSVHVIKVVEQLDEQNPGDDGGFTDFKRRKLQDECPTTDALLDLRKDYSDQFRPQGVPSASPHLDACCTGTKCCRITADSEVFCEDLALDTASTLPVGLACSRTHIFTRTASGDVGRAAIPQGFEGEDPFALAPLTVSAAAKLFSGASATCFVKEDGTTLSCVDPFSQEATELIAPLEEGETIKSVSFGAWYDADYNEQSFKALLTSSGRVLTAGAAIYDGQYGEEFFSADFVVPQAVTPTEVPAPTPVVATPPLTFPTAMLRLQWSSRFSAVAADVYGAAKAVAQQLALSTCAGEANVVYEVLWSNCRSQVEIDFYVIFPREAIDEAQELVKRTKDSPKAIKSLLANWDGKFRDFRDGELVEVDFGMPRAIPKKRYLVETIAELKALELPLFPPPSVPEVCNQAKVVPRSKKGRKLAV